VQKALSFSIASVKDDWSRYIFLVGIVDENKKLKKEIEELKAVFDFISGELSGSAKVEKASISFR